MKSDPIRQRVREQAEQTYRAAILDAAEQVFVAQGYHEARMADVARAVGVSVGTLYNYFENKEAVFASLLEQREAQFLESLEAAASDETDAPALHLVRTLLALVEQRGSLLLLFTQLGVVSENDIRRVAGPEADKCRQRYRDVLTRGLAASIKRGELRRDIPAARLASALAGAINALIFDWLREGRPPGLPERGAQVYQLFVEGAGA